MERFLADRALEGVVCGGLEVVATSAGGGVGVVAYAVGEAVIAVDAAAGGVG